MKKKNKLFLTALAVGSLMLTGCNKDKVLTCVQSEQQVSEMEIKIKFGKDKIKSFEMTMDYDYTSVNEVQFETIKSRDLCSEFNKSWDESFKSCKQSEKNKIITIKAEIDENKINTLIGNSAEANDIEKARESFENSGFTCTIKK